MAILAAAARHLRWVHQVAPACPACRSSDPAPRRGAGGGRLLTLACPTCGHHWRVTALAQQVALPDGRQELRAC
jgi:hypothetical protein